MPKKIRLRAHTHYNTYSTGVLTVPIAAQCKKMCTQ